MEKIDCLHPEGHEQKRLTALERDQKVGTTAHLGVMNGGSHLSSKGISKSGIIAKPYNVRLA